MLEYIEGKALGLVRGDIKGNTLGCLIGKSLDRNLELELGELLGHVDWAIYRNTV